VQVGGAALWAFMRPILSPRLVALDKDGFVFDSGVGSSVDLDAHRANSDLDGLDLGDDEHAAAAQKPGQAGGPAPSGSAGRRGQRVTAIVRARPPNNLTGSPRSAPALGSRVSCEPSGAPASLLDIPASLACTGLRGIGAGRRAADRSYEPVLDALVESLVHR
jgi:hypothetical protein